MKPGYIKMLLRLALCVMAWSLWAQDYAITKKVVGSGHQASGGSYSLQGSSGQTVVGQSDGNDFEVSAGYWQSNQDLIFKDDYE